MKNKIKALLILWASCFGLPILYFWFIAPLLWSHQSSAAFWTFIWMSFAAIVAIIFGIICTKETIRVRPI